MIWILAIIPWPAVEGECCAGTQGIWHNPCGSYCCGCGPCNIFCCNCADGCNKGYQKQWPDNGVVTHSHKCNHKKKRFIDSYHSYLKAEKKFNEVDADGSRNITIDEADQYLKRQSQYKRDTTISLKDEIEKMDENNDGIISPFEFDSSLHY